MAPAIMIKGGPDSIAGQQFERAMAAQVKSSLAKLMEQYEAEMNQDWDEEQLWLAAQLQGIRTRQKAKGKENRSKARKLGAELRAELKDMQIKLKEIRTEADKMKDELRAGRKDVDSKLEENRKKAVKMEAELSHKIKGIEIQMKEGRKEQVKMEAYLKTAQQDVKKSKQLMRVSTARSLSGCRRSCV